MIDPEHSCRFAEIDCIAGILISNKYCLAQMVGLWFEHQSIRLLLQWPSRCCCIRRRGRCCRGLLPDADSYQRTERVAVVDQSLVAAGTVPALSIHDARMEFAGVKALRGVNLELRSGQVHALLGPNGCGKSTLIKVLAGFHEPAKSTVLMLGGGRYEPWGTAPRAERIRFVHQDLGLVDEFNTIDNFALTLGYQRRRSGRIDWLKERRRAERLVRKFVTDLDVTMPLARLTQVQRTTVAIARALADVDGVGSVLVLDEPTASLSNVEVQELLTTLREVRATGTAILYVSHRMDEIFEIADGYTVLRNGSVVGQGQVADTNAQILVDLIAGESISARDRSSENQTAFTSTGRDTFEVFGLTGPTLHDVGLTVRSGEIVGIAGLLGSGRDEIPYAAVGESRDGTSARWKINGAEWSPRGIGECIERGIAFVPGERLREGVIASFSVLENASLAVLSKLGTRGWLAKGVEREQFNRYMEKLKIPIGAQNRSVVTLSGGNQQKVLLTRWLWVRPRLIILAEPTAGVDVGTRHALYKMIRAQAATGLAVLVASSDFDDLVELCDRVVTLRSGTIVDESVGAEISATNLVALMEGVDN